LDRSTTSACARLGGSISHFLISAGTIGAVVYYGRQEHFPDIKIPGVGSYRFAS